MATRCIACGTIFRVVQDQLKVSEGWVRCGRCDEVFNALESLFDLERESPPPWQPGMAPQAARETSDAEQGAADLDEDDRIASRFFAPHQEDVEHTPAEAVDERDRTDFADAQFNLELLAEEDDAMATTIPIAASNAPSRRRKTRRERKPKPAADEPGFVRHAQRQERWQSPAMRTALSSAAVFLLIALTLQVANQFRDLAAARHPSLRPWLVAWCGLSGCQIEQPRRIEDVTVENSALARATAEPDTFKLTVTLRNRGTLALRMPSIDLSLTDTSGQLVARRVLRPAEFTPVRTTLPPGTDTALELTLSTGTSRVAGYTVEAFYP